MAFPAFPSIGQNFLDAASGEMYVYLGRNPDSSPRWVKTTDEDIAHVSEDETVTGKWNFSQSISIPSGASVSTDTVELSGSSLVISSDAGQGSPGISFGVNEIFDFTSNNVSLLALNSAGALRVSGSYGTAGQVLVSNGPNARLTWGNRTTGTINGTAWDGTSAITTGTWGASRNITIGSSTKAVNGSTDLTWSLADLGVSASTVNLTGDQTVAGVKTFSSSVISAANFSGMFIDQDANNAPFFGSVQQVGDTFAPIVKIRSVGSQNTSTFSLGVHHRTDATQVGILHFIQNGDVNDRRWEFHQTGDFVSSGNVTAYSDARLKTDVTKIEDAMSKVQQLNGYTFTRIDSGARQTGVIAQEVQKVLPEAVVEGEYLGVAYGNIVGLLIEAIKDLKAEIDALKGGK